MKCKHDNQLLIYLFFKPVSKSLSLVLNKVYLHTPTHTHTELCEMY